MDLTLKVCKCFSHYFDVINNITCQVCKDTCKECSSFSVCTECYTELNYILKVNTCQCKVHYYEEVLICKGIN